MVGGWFRPAFDKQHADERPLACIAAERGVFSWIAIYPASEAYTRTFASTEPTRPTIDASGCSNAKGKGHN